MPELCLKDSPGLVYTYHAYYGLKDSLSSPSRNIPLPAQLKKETACFRNVHNRDNKLQQDGRRMFLPGIDKITFNPVVYTSPGESEKNNKFNRH